VIVVMTFIIGAYTSTMIMIMIMSIPSGSDCCDKFMIGACTSNIVIIFMSMITFLINTTYLGKLPCFTNSFLFSFMALIVGHSAELHVTLLAYGSQERSC